MKKRLELLIEEKFGGQITYSCKGMRHRDEEETYYLEKGDKLYIKRRKNENRKRNKR